MWIVIALTVVSLVVYVLVNKRSKSLEPKTLRDIAPQKPAIVSSPVVAPPSRIKAEPISAARYYGAFDRIVFTHTRPDGNWVNWKIGSGWFEVAGVSMREQEVRRFAHEASAAQNSGIAHGIHLKPEPDNAADQNAIQVFGWIRTEREEVLLGYVPRDVAAEAAKFIAILPIAAELKQIAMGDGAIFVSVAGLWPPVQDRRDAGYEGPLVRAPSSVSLTDDDIGDLEVLVAEMNAKKPITWRQARRLAKKRTQALMEAFDSPDPIAPEENPYAFFNQDGFAAGEYLKSIANDLPAQVKIVRETFAYWLKTGDIVPPHYPNRIAIILRKSKQADLERRFLAAWCRHFPEGNGVGYEGLIERAKKCGAIPASADEQPRDKDES